MILEKDQIIQKEIISYLAIDQIRTIDKSRIVKELGSLNTGEIKKTKEVLLKTFVL